MTAEQVAEHLDARRTGRGKWQARCPAHDDRSPSLSIAEGEGGRVLVRCWAGCDTRDVLSAAGLRWVDLYAGPPPTPAQAARLAQERAAREAGRDRERQADRQARDRMRKLEAIVNALGGKLMRSPEDDELGRLFELALDRLHDTEMDVEQSERPAANGPQERIA